MSIDKETVRRIARLARIATPEERLEPLVDELNSILKWVEQLGEVNTDAVTPMTSAVSTELPWREDEVDDGGRPADIVKNAPLSEDNFFLVPKVVE